MLKPIIQSYYSHFVFSSNLFSMQRLFACFYILPVQCYLISLICSYTFSYAIISFVLKHLLRIYSVPTLYQLLGFQSEQIPTMSSKNLFFTGKDI